MDATSAAARLIPDIEPTRLRRRIAKLPFHTAPLAFEHEVLVWNYFVRSILVNLANRNLIPP